MRTITERLKDAVNQFPAIEEHPRKLFVDSLAEIERLQEQIFEQRQYKDFYTAVDYSKSFIMQKQAAAVESEIVNLCSDLRKSGYSGISVKELLHESVSRSSRIRNEAKKFDDQ